MKSELLQLNLNKISWHILDITIKYCLYDNDTSLQYKSYESFGLDAGEMMEEK